MPTNELENERPGLTGFEIAVIGMSGRFPGSGNIEEFWENLKNGREGITFFTDEELKEVGMSDKVLQSPRYVKAYGWLDKQLFFDAAFFGYTPAEAELMDPQIRLFHECAYEALEDAGYDSSTYKKPIGLYAGASANLPWQSNINIANISAWFASKQLTDKDFLATRIAYKLNLHGPAMTVDTACSTSLTAIHLAIQGLLSGDCDMALSGGVTAILYSKSGYFYEQGMILSSDGHTRAFDAKANGSNMGDAAAIVVLKRYSDAVEDRDTIHAVIKGSAINNDGNRKAAYTAPSVEGQASVIRTAHRMAEVDPETITYVETHGTGTILGDPVEIEGLKAAFNTKKKHFCRIGSVKSNVGHLEMAAGVAGFIKTVLALKHKQIPPTLCFETPSPKIDFANSPFVVNTQLTEWKRITPGLPLRAGVSSFGIGGTNVHIILEEAPEVSESVGQWVSESVRKAPEGTRGLTPLPNRQYQLILLSAKTETALEKMTQNLAEYFKKNLLNRGSHKNPTNPGPTLADAAYTLQVGRQVFPHRRMLVCPGNDIKETVNLLSTGSRKLKTYKSEEDNRPIIFLFSGLGAQYENMGRELYEKEPLFRGEMDRCFKILNSLVDYDIKEILYPSDRSDTLINQPGISQVAVFIFEYALAQLLMAWGIKPHALMGYSFGEYTAACVSGVFSLKDGLKLVVSRGQLLQETPLGAMLSVPLPPGEITPLLNLNPGLSLAIDNGPSCLVSGPNALIDTFAKQMKEKRVVCMRIGAERAIHSGMMNPAAKKLASFLNTIPLNKPKFPYVSNVTGDWQTDKEAVSPAYWARHLQETVQFDRGMKTLLKKPGAIFVEIGPGRDISTLALRHLESDNNAQHRVLNLVKAPNQDISDVYFLLNRIGRLWMYGQSIDWDEFYGGQKNQRHRISLPPYPFERQLYQVDEISRGTNQQISFQDKSAQPPDFADGFYIPSWKRLPIPAQQAGEMPRNSCWLLFIDECGLGTQLLKQLERENQTVVTVKSGETFLSENNRQFTINPQQGNDYERLFNELHHQDMMPGRIVHLWGVTPNDSESLDLARETTAAADIREALNAQDLGFYSLQYIARAIGKSGIKHKVHLGVITNNMQEVTGKDGIYPVKVTVLGPVKIIPTEYMNITCRSIDILGSQIHQEAQLVKRLRDELISGAADMVVAYRGDYRWVQSFEPLHLKELPKEHTPLKPSGVYLITGGLGELGLTLAEYLAKSVQPTLLLTARTPLPPKNQWEQWLSHPHQDKNIITKIKKIKELEESGAEVLVFCADAANRQQMQQVIAQAEKHAGPINGIIHCAGLADGEMIYRRTPARSVPILSPKVTGTLILHDLFKDHPLDFLILCSSLTAILPFIGQVGYSAANAFLDAFAHWCSHSPSVQGKWGSTVSINWDRWQGVGIARIAEKQHKEFTGEDLAGGIPADKGIEALRRIMADPQPQVIVSPGGDLNKRMIKAYTSFSPSAFKESPDSPSAAKPLHKRPDLNSEYVPPKNKGEQKLAHIWQHFFGIDQIGIQDDFIELGGDSLKAIQMLTRIQKELNVSVPLTEFFKQPTIERLANYIFGAEKNIYQSITPVEKKEYYPLSPAQKRLYFIHLLAPESTAYNETDIFTLVGEVDKNRLEKTFKKLIQRHESLKTSYVMVGDEPVQRIHETVDFAIEYFTADPGERTNEIINSFFKPFNLSQAPLLRAGLLKPGSFPTILMVDMHHIGTDGVSIQIQRKDFMSLYAKMELPPLKLQYKDFSEWQNRQLKSGEIKKQEEYWVNRFKGHIPALVLPTDYPRPPDTITPEGGSIDFMIDGQLAIDLRRALKETGTTMYMFLLTVYYILLAKYSGQEDIVVGSPVAGRRHDDLKEIIGMFVNMLSLRNQPAKHKTFKQFLEEVKINAIDAYDNQDYQFDELVSQLGLQGTSTQNPMFRAVFGTIDIDEPAEPVLEDEEAGEIEEKPFEYQKFIPKYDLRLAMSDLDTKVFLCLQYSKSIFKDTSTEKMSKRYMEILEQVLKKPGILLKDITLSHELLITKSHTLQQYEEGFEF